MKHHLIHCVAGSICLFGLSPEARTQHHDTGRHSAVHSGGHAKGHTKAHTKAHTKGHAKGHTIDTDAKAHASHQDPHHAHASHELHRSLHGSHDIHASHQDRGGTSGIGAFLHHRDALRGFVSHHGASARQVKELSHLILHAHLEMVDSHAEVTKSHLLLAWAMHAGAGEDRVLDAMDAYAAATNDARKQVARSLFAAKRILGEKTWKAVTAHAGSHLHAVLGHAFSPPHGGPTHGEAHHQIKKILHGGEDARHATESHRVHTIK